MLAHQNEDRRGTMSNRSTSPRITPLTSDHVHVQHRNFDDSNSSQVHSRSIGEPALSNGMIYGHPRNGEESSSTIGSVSHEHSRNSDLTTRRSSSANFLPRQEIETNGSKADDRVSEKSFGMQRRASYNNNKKPFISSCAYNRKTQEGAVYYPNKQNDLSHWQNVTNEMAHEQHRANSQQQQQQQQCIARPESAYSRCRRNDLSSTRDGQRIQSRNDHHCSGAASHEHYQTRESGIGEAVSSLQSIPSRFIRDNGKLIWYIWPRVELSKVKGVGALQISQMSVTFIKSFIRIFTHMMITVDFYFYHCRFIRLSLKLVI